MLFLLMEFDGNKNMNLLQEIYSNNASKMYSIAISILHNPNDAEDAVHDAIVSIVKNISRYDKLTPAELQALCVVITRNKCLDYMRKMNRFSTVDIDEIRLPLDKTESSPETLLVQKEDRYEVQKIISLLPEIYREIIVLRYYYGWGIKKIAKLLNIPVKTVDSRLYRAKKMVGRFWEDEKKGN